MADCIDYFRRSKDREDEQILSLEGQQDSVKAMPDYNSYNPIATFKESHSAKEPNKRPYFNKMCEMIEQGKASFIRGFALNRLARNPVDGGRIIWLVQAKGLKIITPTKTYDQNDILLMYVEFGMSNNFILDLQKGVKRGLGQKIEKGVVPLYAPIGFKNTPERKQGTREILDDNENNRFNLCRKMWDLLLTKQYSPPRILKIATEEWGLRKRNGKKLTRSGIYHFFTNIFYTGKYYYYKGVLHDNGVHRPMITIEEFEQAQKILGRKGKPSVTIREFAHAKWMKCPCGGFVSAHEKYRKICPSCQKKYNAEKHERCPKCKTPAPEKTYYYCYYGCSHRVDPNCKEKETTLKKLEKQIDDQLAQLTLHQDFVDWAMKKLRKDHEVHTKARREIDNSLQVALRFVTNKLDTLFDNYISPNNKNHELISEEQYKIKRQELTKEKIQLEEQIKAQSRNQDQWLDTAEKIYNFARNARYWFEHGTKQQKREIALALGSNPIFTNRIALFDDLKPLLAMKKVVTYAKTKGEQLEPKNGKENIDISIQTNVSPNENLPVCGREDLNLHALRHSHLKTACIPISPRPHVLL